MTFRSIFAIVCIGLSVMSAAGQELNSATGTGAAEIVWVLASFQEVRSASPVVGQATMPLPLALAAVNSVPANVKADSRKDGFDIDIIAQAVAAMPINQTFELTKKDYNLRIRKVRASAQTDVQPSMLYINNDTVKLPIPLIFTGTAVSALQMAFEELKGMEEPLNAAMEELKRTPPGVLVTGRDTLTEGWLTITLE